MKFRIISCILAVVMIVSLGATVHAVTPSALLIDSGLSFENETACCTVDIYANDMDDSIFAIVKLCDEDGNGVKTWVQSGTGILNFSRTIGVTSGEEYTLRAYVTVNDVSKPSVYITKTCP